MEKAEWTGINWKSAKVLTKNKIFEQISNISYQIYYYLQVSSAFPFLSSPDNICGISKPSASND